MAISASEINHILAEVFPSFVEEEVSLQELQRLNEDLKHFGICDQGKLYALVKKHRDAIEMRTRAQLSRENAPHHRKMMGDTAYKEKLRTLWWFRYPAVIRIALAEEFGESYASYVFTFFKGDNERI